MRHLIVFESYSSDEVRKLMGDLENAGFEKLKWEVDDARPSAEEDADREELKRWAGKKNQTVKSVTGKIERLKDPYIESGYSIQLNVIFVTKFGEVPLTIKGSIEGPSHFSYIDVMNKNGQQKNIIPGNRNLADDIVEGKPIVTSIIKTIDKEDMINNI